ncbi:MAG: beta-L-arabinofuranosidase domain-containing protein, partial [Promethearchaeota archaeon]
MRSALEPSKLKPLKLGEVKPTGWLKNQLKTQANGLSGHLDKFWPDIMDSGWIGGKAEGWERFPYWLDGVIPLAFLLDSEDLINRIEGYINCILDHQQNEGWFGPSQWGMNPNYDPWPNMILCKALLQYFEKSRDKRIIPALLAYYHKLDMVLDEYSLGYSWAQMRWMDGVWGIHWLIDQLNEDNDIASFLLSLAQKLENLGYNWRKHFDNFYYIHFRKDPVSQVLYSKTSISPEDTLENQPKGKLRGIDLRSHVVNNAMGIKSSTVWSRQSGLDSDKQAVLRAISTLDRYHGQVTGMFSGDEHFAGKNPSQGTELCSVVEYMFSLETVIPILGSSREGVMLIDRLEKICFNALPATFLPDMWAHQYDQQVNQVQAKRVKKPIYTTNGKDSNIYGLEPNYGCCTANMHQGWPKFVEYGLWAKDNDGLVCLAYSPCKISTNLTVNNKVRVINIEETTDYPFSD